MFVNAALKAVLLKAFHELPAPVPMPCSTAVCIVPCRVFLWNLLLWLAALLAAARRVTHLHSSHPGRSLLCTALAVARASLI